jgi:signal transduction histidine kinase
MPAGGRAGRSRGMPEGGRGRTISLVGLRLPMRLYVAAWTPLAVVFAALFLAVGSSPGVAIRGALVSVLPFLLLGLRVWTLPSELPWRDDRRLRFFAAHLALAALYATFGVAGAFALRNLEAFFVTGRAVPLDLIMVAWQAVMGGLLYVAVAGTAYAWWNDRRLREEAARTAHAEALRARAELAALRSQLNPHFLLNTLHAALGLVRRDPERAERAIERLGELLHYGLRMHREAIDAVALADEWQFVRSYLEIESLRLEKRLRLELEADPEALRGSVPPFVLQALVENAIVHAIAPRREGGRVSVRADRRDDRLRLEVRDDGPGFATGGTAGGAGLGIRLLRERLALLYGSDARLAIGAGEGGGVHAVLDLPFVPAAGPEPA